MAKVKDETRYKRKVREKFADFGLWTEAYEPAMGSGTGYPDIQVLGKCRRILPIELKVGEIKGGRLFPREVRGDQVVWHRKFSRFGGISCCFIGVETPKYSENWATYAVSGAQMLDWKAGYDLSECHIAPRNWPIELVEIVNFYLNLGPVSPCNAAQGHDIPQQNHLL